MRVVRSATRLSRAQWFAHFASRTIRSGGRRRWSARSDRERRRGGSPLRTDVGRPGPARGGGRCAGVGGVGLPNRTRNEVPFARRWRRSCSAGRAGGERAPARTSATTWINASTWRPGRRPWTGRLAGVSTRPVDDAEGVERTLRDGAAKRSVAATVTGWADVQSRRRGSTVEPARPSIAGAAATAVGEGVAADAHLCDGPNAVPPAADDGEARAHLVVWRSEWRCRGTDGGQPAE